MTKFLRNVFIPIKKARRELLNRELLGGTNSEIMNSLLVQRVTCVSEMSTETLVYLALGHWL